MVERRATRRESARAGQAHLPEQLCASVLSWFPPSFSNSFRFRGGINYIRLMLWALVRLCDVFMYALSLSPILCQFPFVFFFFVHVLCASGRMFG
jgi:hypothetical protein